MVDDPSAHPERFPTEESQEKERARLFGIIEQLVLWENTNNEVVLSAARSEIWINWRLTCAQNQGHPRSSTLFDPTRLPSLHDPFAGGGAIPMEAQRLGLESYASDLNPVAVLINKALIEIPPKMVGLQPVNPSRQKSTLIAHDFSHPHGLFEDVGLYGAWIRDQAERRLGHLYPKFDITAKTAEGRADLGRYVGRSVPVIACLWARTVKSPNPAFANVDVPLARISHRSTA